MDFESWTRAHLEDLKEDNAHITDTIRGLEEKRAANDVKIAELQRSLEIFREFNLGQDESHPRDVPPTEDEQQEGFIPLTDDLRQLLLQSSIPDGAQLILEEAGGVARTADIARVLVLAGKIKSKYAPNQVYASLLRHPGRFEKADAGLWRLSNASSTTNSQRQVTA